MNEGLRNRLLNAALILAGVSAGLFAASYPYWRMNHLGVFTTPDWCLTAVAGVTSLISFGVLFRGPPSVKASVVYICYLALCVEVVLQALAYAGLIPGLSFFHHSPYARVYETDECFGNARMNRYGWYYPETGTAVPSRRIALIGDSFIQGVQVQPEENIGIALQRMFDKQQGITDRPAVDVVSLGIGDIGPAGYLLLLEHAAWYYRPTEVFIFVFFCNDLQDCSYEIKRDSAYFDPLFGLYYDLDLDGTPEIRPESIPARERFVRRLEANRRSLFFNLPGIVRNNCLSFVVLKELTQRVAGGRNRPAEDPAEDLLGCSEFMFLKDEPKRARDAFMLAVALLEASHRLAVEKNIILRFVTVPTFPKSFLDTGDWEDWGLAKGKYDVLLPERTFVGWARERGISVLPMGQYIRTNGLDVRAVRELFCLPGAGHWSRRGHEYWAEAIYRTYYEKPPETEPAVHR